MVNQDDRDKTMKEDQDKNENYKNPETAVNRANKFNDEYASKEEDNIASDEARSEKAKRSGS